MKRLFLIMVAMMCITTLSAQKLSLGGRVGSGFQAVGQYEISDKSYVEARFGASWNNPQFTREVNGHISQHRVMADFTALYNWRVLELDWTPSTGLWFFDAGCGVNVGGREHYTYVGAAGMARLGIKFYNVPLSLSFDWTPSFGPNILYAGSVNYVAFNSLGIANLGISCMFNF